MQVLLNHYHSTFNPLSSVSSVTTSLPPRMASISLPYCSYLLLHIDIPVLAATRDGWNVLKASVCKLFTRSGDVR